MMKCRFCEQKASVNMRHHKLALCKDHFIAWIQQQTEQMIEQYSMFSATTRILVAVSGGKDSLALWDILNQLGFQADGLYIHLGIDSGIAYSDASQASAQRFAADHGLNLLIADIRDLEGSSIPEATLHSKRGRDKPCSICGLSKRSIMNRIAHEKGYEVLATGHNLDDEAAVLLGNVLSWQMSYLRRQGPVLESTRQGFVRKVKPFFRLYERDVAAYAFLRGIAYMQEECPFAEGATSIYYKELLNQMEAKSPGRKMHFYLAFLKAKQEGFMHLDLQDPDNHSPVLHRCENCGQPTTTQPLCAYCRTWSQVRQSKAANA